MSIYDFECPLLAGVDRLVCVVQSLLDAPCTDSTAMEPNAMKQAFHVAHAAVLCSAHVDRAWSEHSLTQTQYTQVRDRARVKLGSPTEPDAVAEHLFRLISSYVSPACDLNWLRQVLVQDFRAYDALHAGVRPELPPHHWALAPSQSQAAKSGLGATSLGVQPHTPLAPSTPLRIAGRIEKQKSSRAALELKPQFRDSSTPYDVVCGGIVATYRPDIARFSVGGEEMTGCALEALAGVESKNWKRSVRLLQPDGRTGDSIATVFYARPAKQSRSEADT